MTIKSGKGARPYKVTYVKHELAGDQEVTRFSIGDTYEDINGRKKWVYFRVTVWENLPLVDGDEVRLLYYYDFSINSKIKKMPDGSTSEILIYGMAAKVERIEKEKA